MNLTLLRNAFSLYFMATLTAMAPMNLSFFALLFLFLWNLKSPSPFSQLSVEFRNYRFWALILLGACWGSLAVAKIFPFAYADHPPEITLHGFVKIWYLLIPGILLFIYRILSHSTAFNLLNLLQPWWWTTLALLPIALIQFWTGWPQAQPIPTNPGKFHAILFFGHHLSTSSIVIFPAFTALAVALGFYSRSKKTPSPVPPLFALLVGLSGMAVLFLSFARTAWISLFLGTLILLKKYWMPRFNRRQIIAGLFLFLILLGIFSQTPLVKERIIRTFGVSERVELWKANFDFFLHRPLSGIGWLKTQEMSEFYFKSIDPENYRSRFWGHAHSNFFEMLGGTGLLGLLAFFGWSWFTLRFSLKLSRRFEEPSDKVQGSHLFYSDFSYGIFIALVLLHINGLTNVTFWEGKVMHQQMLAVGLLLILDSLLKPEIKNENGTIA